MRNRFWPQILLFTLVVVFTALPAGARTVSDPAETTQAEGSATGNKPVAIATGGYWFIIPKDFNGGIFGTTTDIENRLTFNAKRDADGTVTGWYNYEQAADGTVFKFAGPVTCMGIYDTPVLPRTSEVPALTQNRAKWGGRVDFSTDPTFPVGTFIWFQSMDNGEGSMGWTDSSSLPAFGDEATNIRFCNSDRVPNPNFGPHRIGGGNIQVR
ncbi:MAG TPA: hypothetical protein VGR67_11855 [Candidatus Polarisedimenticolia bacterium]|jgi:hypothetical protein|nr:hypothetical protein [Candidatus Polarisedimenticolia bacterium]